MECFTHDQHDQNLHIQRYNLREYTTNVHIKDDLNELFVRILKEMCLDMCLVKGFQFKLLILHILEYEEEKITLPYIWDLLNIQIAYPNYVFATAFDLSQKLKRLDFLQWAKFCLNSTSLLFFQI